MVIEKWGLVPAGSLMERFQNELASMESIFNSVFSNYGNEWEFNKSNFPKSDIIEAEDKFIIEMGISGFKKSDVKIELDGQKLKISGQKKERQENLKYHLKELSNRNFQKVVILPASVEKDKIEAKFEDGILTIELPKDQKAVDNNKIKLIDIK